MSDVMSSTAAKSPKPLRRAVGAVPIPSAQHEAWYAHASAVPGLNAVELGVLDVIAASHRQLQERGFGMVLSYDRLAHRLAVDAVHVRWAVNRLLELGLIGVQSGRGGQANTYSMTLPRRLAASLSTAAAADTPVPPF
jgi:hypothetical protein